MTFREAADRLGADPNPSSIGDLGRNATPDNAETGTLYPDRGYDGTPTRALLVDLSFHRRACP